MTVLHSIVIAIVMMMADSAWATYYWASPAGSAAASCASIDSASLDTDPGSYGTIGQAARCATVAGDEVIVKAGTYTNADDGMKFGSTDRNIVAGQFVSGTSETIRTKIRGNPAGARPVIKIGGTWYCSYVGAERSYITFQYLEIDEDYGGGCSATIQINGQHVTLDDVEVYESKASLVAFNSNTGTDTSKAAFGVVRNSHLHDAAQTAGSGSPNGYGVYAQSTDIIVENSHIHHTKGWAIHYYTGTSNTPNNGIVRKNYIHDTRVGVTNEVNLFCGGIVMQATGAKIYDNVIDIGSTSCTTHNSDDAPITIRGSGNSVEIYNNAVQTVAGDGVEIGSQVGSAVVRNNVFGVIPNGNAITNLGSAVLTSTHNACTSSQSCGSTGKVTITALSNHLINFPSDARLKTGANTLRNAGTSVPTRTSPVGVTDIGPYEQGEVASATVSSGFIEITTNIGTPGLVPSTGITGVTISCVGCTGSPVAAVVGTKSGANNVMQVTVTGISSSGTCTISLGATNATDSAYINGLAQGLNTASGVSVSGTCNNTGGASPGSGLWSHFPLSEGSGTTANDDSGSANHGTVSSGVTWVSGGVSIPTDTTYRQVASTYGSGVNPTTQDFTACVFVVPDTTQTQKVVLSSGGNGTSQRWYAGFATVGGQLQWGIGAQGSGFSTGSEFVVTAAQTLVCLISDATADTVTLSVNGVMGTRSGQSIKTVTSYTLVGNIIAGNDGTFTSNNGGFTIYDLWVWNNKQSASDILTLYQSLTPGGTTPCLAQTHRQFERVHTTSGGSPITITPKADGSIDVVKDGGVAVRVQYSCTGAAGTVVALQLFYSTDGGSTFPLPIPTLPGAQGIGMWGEDLDAYFNDGVSTGCVDGTGFTENSGITVLTATAGPTFSLAQNHCRSDRYILRFTQEGTFYVRVHTDSGLTFANGYTQTIKFNVIPMQTSLGFR